MSSTRPHPKPLPRRDATRRGAPGAGALLLSAPAPAASRWLDRLAWALAAAFGVLVLAILLGPHRVGDVFTETDFYGAYGLDARALQAGHLDPSRYGVVGPVHEMALALLGFVVRDLFLAAELLSAASMVAALLLWHRIARERAGALPALLTVAFLATNAQFLRYGYAATTDALALAVQAGALALLLTGAPRPRRLFAAGALAGLAFLTRYNAVALLPAGALALAFGWAGVREGGPRADARRCSFAPAGSPRSCRGSRFRSRAAPRSPSSSTTTSPTTCSRARRAFPGTPTSAIWSRNFDALVGDRARSGGGVRAHGVQRRRAPDARRPQADRDAGRDRGARRAAVRLARRFARAPARGAARGGAAVPRARAGLPQRALVARDAAGLGAARGDGVRLAAAGAGVAHGPPGAAAGGRLWLKAVLALVPLALAAKVSLAVQKRVFDQLPVEVLEIAREVRPLLRPGDRVMARKPNFAWHAGLSPVAFPFVDSLSQLAAAARRGHVRWLYFSWPEAEMRPDFSYLLDTTSHVPGLTPRAVTEHWPAVLYEIGPGFGRDPAWLTDVREHAVHRARAQVAISNVDWMARLVLATDEQAKGRFEEAQRLLDQAARIAPREPDVLLALGDNLLRTDRPAEAAETFDRLESLRPGDPRTRIGRGWAAALQHQDADAMALWAPVVSFASDAATLRRMHQLFVAAGDRGSAAEAAARMRALGIAP